MVTGTFGDIVFQASRQKVSTFTDLQRESGVRLNATEIIGRAPIVQFEGPGEDTISFSMHLVDSLGVDPQTEYARLRAIMDRGEARTLAIGGELVGNAGEVWAIEKLSAAYSNAFAGGSGMRPAKCQQITVSVSLKKFTPWGSGWRSI